MFLVCSTKSGKSVKIRRCLIFIVALIVFQILAVSVLNDWNKTNTFYSPARLDVTWRRLLAATTRTTTCLYLVDTTNGTNHTSDKSSAPLADLHERVCALRTINFNEQLDDELLSAVGSPSTSTLVIDYAAGQDKPHHLVELMRQLSTRRADLNVFVRVRLLSAMPSVASIGVVRHMARACLYLIVNRWSDHARLVDVYGVSEAKLVHVPSSTSAPGLGADASERVSDQYMRLFDQTVAKFANALDRIAFNNELVSSSGNISVPVSLDEVDGGEPSTSLDVLELVKHLTRETKLKQGLYCLYVDPRVQVNARVSSKYGIETLGIKVSNHRLAVIVDRKFGIDEFRLDTSDSSPPNDIIAIDYRANRLSVNSGSVRFVIQKADNADILVEFVRSSNAGVGELFGLVAGCLQKSNSNDIKKLTTMTRLGDIDQLVTRWLISDPMDFFSHSALGQVWSSPSAPQLNANVFIIDDDDQLELAQVQKQPIDVHIYGPFFKAGGFHLVNRRIYFEMLRRRDTFRVFIQPTKRMMRLDERNAEILYTYSLFRRQLITPAPSVKTNATIGFLNSFPPITQRPNTTFVVTQLLWVTRCLSFSLSLNENTSTV